MAKKKDASKAFGGMAGKAAKSLRNRGRNIDAMLDKYESTGKSKTRPGK